MKRIFYALLLITIGYSTTKACYREPSIFEKIAEADVIATVKFQFIDTTTHTVESKYSKSGWRTYTTYNYAIFSTQNFKGELSSERISLSSWQHKSMSGNQITLFMHFDSSRTALYTDYIMNLTSESTSGAYFSYYYTPTEAALLEFCKGMQGIESFPSAKEYIQTVNAATNAINDNNYADIYGQLRKLKYILYASFHPAQDWHLVNEKTIAKTKEYFEKTPYKPSLLVEMAYNLKFDNFKEVLVGHLNDYYCQSERGNFSNLKYRSSYASSLENYLLKTAETKADKIQVASFIRMRYMHSSPGYYMEREAPIFDSLYDGLLISSDIENINSSTLSWDEKKQVKELLVAKIVTYQPKNNEPKLRTTFCTSEPAATPKLKFSMAPNPTDGAFVLSFEDVNPEEEIFIEVIGVGGDVIYQTSIIPYGTNFNKEFNIGHLEAGVYHIRIFNKYSIDTKMIQKY